jgi:putative glycosyl hydrolase
MCMLKMLCRWHFALFVLLSFSAACGSGSMGSSTPPSGSLTLSLTPNSAQVFQGQATAVTVNATLAESGTTGSVTLNLTGLPPGATDQIQSPGDGNSGSIGFNAGTAAAGTYPITVTASDGTLSSTAMLTLTIGASAQIMSGTNGTFGVAMSTSFQPAEWDDQFFSTNPGATTTLGNLLPQHIRLQAVSEGVPQGAPDSSSTTWNFSVVDAITQPVLSVGDHSPEFQIAKAPPFMYSGDDSGNGFSDLTFQQFAGYAQNLVRYYDKGGFTANGQNYVSPSYPADTITWWGIYNEPNINNNLTPQQYVQMYNTLVPAMQAIDPSLRFVGVELADFSGQPQAWLPAFVNVGTGVTARVDAMATHFYSTCDQADDDATVFASIPGFVSDVNYFYSEMATNPALASVPVWVTENNVNADFDKGGGISACNGTTFVPDPRGSSAFFAAWRPYVFSQLGKAGVQALYHWDFDADVQFGEVNYNNDAVQLSYWVDYWLARMFPSPPGANLLQSTNSDNAEIEVLAVQNPDGSVLIMLANHALNAASDNNGPGAPRTVDVDVSGLGSFQSASLLTIDANTSVSTGPTAVSVTPQVQMTVSFNGYGVAFLTLK